MCRLFLVSTALLLILFGSAGLLMVPKIIQQKIEQRLQLKIGTKSFERFTRVPIPLTVKFYIFNITNSEQVLQGTERPKFEQVGPFMYKQWRRRDIVDLIDHNRRIVYKEFKTYYPMFNSSTTTTNNSTFGQNNVINNTQTSTTRQQSMQTHNNRIINDNNAANTTDQSPIEYLNPHDFNVTIVNVPLLSVLTKLANINKGLKLKLVKKVATNLIKDGREKILISRRASELLFDGYKVALMETAEDLISKTLGFNFESPLKQNMFGFFYGKNNTWARDQSGEMTVFTGRNESMNDFMLVDSWNGMKKLKVWPSNTVAGDRCNRIKGTDGSQFHPGLDKQQPLSIFSPMICTSIEASYRMDTTAKGIPLYRYSTGPSAFAAPKKNAQNACYCTIPDQPDESSPVSGRLTQTTTTATAMTETATTAAATTATDKSLVKRSAIDQSRCYLDGIIDLSLCQKGAPIAASSPHFYQADPMLAMATGLEPDPVQHQTYLDIEPMTGAVMRAASRAQLNAFVEPAALDIVEPEIIGHMTPMIAPLLWLEESAEIDDKSANDFKQQLLKPVKKFRCLCMAAIIIGVLVIVGTTIHFIYFTCYPCGSTSSDKQKMTKRSPGQRGYERSSAGKSREHWTGGGSGGSGGGGRRDRGGRRRSQLDANLRLAASGNEAATGAKMVQVDRENGRSKRQPAAGDRRTRLADYEDDEDDTGGLFSEDSTDLVQSDSGAGAGASCSSASCYDRSPDAATRAKDRQQQQQQQQKQKQKQQQQQRQRERQQLHRQTQQDDDEDEADDERRDLIKGQAAARGPVTSAL